MNLETGGAEAGLVMDAGPFKEHGIPSVFYRTLKASLARYHVVSSAMCGVLQIMHIDMNWRCSSAAGLLQLPNVGKQLVLALRHLCPARAQ